MIFPNSNELQLLKTIMKTHTYIHKHCLFGIELSSTMAYEWHHCNMKRKYKNQVELGLLTFLRIVCSQVGQSKYTHENLLCEFIFSF